MAEDRKLLWKSPNKKWEIYDDSKKASPYVAQVYVTDGWYNHYAAIDEDGRITTGLYNTYWEYTEPVPKTVQAKAFALLRAMYVNKYRRPQGKKTLPYAYFVKQWANLRDYKGVVPKKEYDNPKIKFFKTYESARKYAESQWKSLTSKQKEYTYLTIGRLNKPFDALKDAPATFGYSHAGEISKDNPLRKR